MYLVVFKTLQGKFAGAITRAEFNDKPTFDQWHDNVKDIFEVVEEGVTKERADELCPIDDDQLTATRHR